MDAITHWTWRLISALRWRRWPRSRPKMRRGGPSNTLQAQIAYNRDGGFCIPLSSTHRPAAQAILAGESWEPETIAYLAQHTSGIVITAGAYFGDMLPALSRYCESIWAFEPNPENFRCAEITLAINNIRNVNIDCVALGEKRAQAGIQTRDPKGRALGGSSSVSLNPDENSTPANIVSLDEHLPRETAVASIHLDIEGFEDKAIAGAEQTISRYRPTLVIEKPSDKLTQMLRDMGYIESRRLHNNIVFQHQDAAAQ